MINSFSNMFSTYKPVIGMIHLLPLLGTPLYEGDFDKIVARAILDARSLKDGGADGALIQNRGDKAFAKSASSPEVISSVTLITKAVQDEVDFPIGVHLLRNDVLSTLAIAKCCGSSFIRVGAAIGVSLLPQGLVEADPSSIIRARNELSAKDIKLFCDVDSFHYKPVTDFPAEEVTKELLELDLADAVIIALPKEEDMLKTIDRIRLTNADVPVILGGYTAHHNIEKLLSAADGAIVGGAFEKGGRNGPVEIEKVVSFMKIVNGVRRGD